MHLLTPAIISPMTPALRAYRRQRFRKALVWAIPLVAVGLGIVCLRDRYQLFVPYVFWAAITLQTVGALLSFQETLRRKHRRQTGLCLHCGYDRRASVGLCPECGNDPTPDVELDEFLKREEQNAKPTVIFLICFAVVLGAALIMPIVASRGRWPALLPPSTLPSRPPARPVRSTLPAMAIATAPLQPVYAPRPVLSDLGIEIPYEQYILFRDGRDLVALRLAADPLLPEQVAYEYIWVSDGSSNLTVPSAIHRYGRIRGASPFGEVTAGPFTFDWSRSTPKTGLLHWPADRPNLSTCTKPLPELKPILPPSDLWRTRLAPSPQYPSNPPTRPVE